MAKAKTTTSKTQKDTPTTSTAPAMSAAPAVAVEKVRSIASAPTAKNPGATKAEKRTNGATSALENEIRLRAYELYLQRGYSSGNETEDWLVAEREVKQRHQQQQNA